MVRRLLQLYVGLGLYGLSTAMFIRSDLGVDPWDVFHLGVGIQLGMTIGTVIILTGAAVLLLWIPLRQMPGLGTISNVICIGLAADASMALDPGAGLVTRANRFPGVGHRDERDCDQHVHWRRFWAWPARRPDDRHSCPAGVVHSQRAYLH
jgi:hypothetical protein